MRVEVTVRLIADDDTVEERKHTEDCDEATPFIAVQRAARYAYRYIQDQREVAA